jgi:uncharacterized protein
MAARPTSVPVIKDLLPWPGRQPRGILGAMYSDGSALKELSRDECLQLMASVPVGRVIYTRRALPAVELVNFALDLGDIVIRTDRSGKLAAAARGAVVAFEADCLDAAQQAGWSVTAIGPSREVTDPEEIGRLQKIALSSWAPGSREHFIRISPVIMTGRHLRANGQQLADLAG